jgi:hypothetical protein
MQAVECAHLKRKRFASAREDDGCELDECDALQQASSLVLAVMTKAACVKAIPDLVFEQAA